MLRQLHVFYKGKQIYNYSYAMALTDEELENVIKTIQSYLDMPIPGKTFQKPLGKYQLFHRTFENNLFLLITDLVDNLEHINIIIEKLINKFKEIFPDTELLKEPGTQVGEFSKFLEGIQHELHSKIAIIGPINSGKSMLYNMLKSNGEKRIMNFAKSSYFQIDNLKFDLWDFQLKDNFSLLWSKVISGADLVLLIFDLSNYHIKVIDHFINLYKQESSLSNLLIIGNKRDLLNDDDIKLIKNELSLTEFKEISLIEPEAKDKIVKLISYSLKVKEKLPQNFQELKNEAEQLILEGNLVLAISKYKELINICNRYQDFNYIKSFKKKLGELQEKVEEEKKIRRKIESKKKFEIPGQIKFEKKITVKPLPLEKVKITDEIAPKAPKVTKKPIETIPSESKAKKLTLFKESGISVKSEDIGLEIDKVISQDLPAKVEESIESSEFPKILQKMIEDKGSSLSLKLCEHLISELQKTLARPLSSEDIKTAAEIFVKQEQLT